MSCLHSSHEPAPACPSLPQPAPACPSLRCLSLGDDVREENLIRVIITAIGQHLPRIIASPAAVGGV